MSEHSTMEALVWTGPRVMSLEAVPVPQVAPGEVLVAVSAAGICGSELSGYLGESSIRVPPLVMGHEASGRLVEDATTPLADGCRPRAGTRVTFNPLVVCGECDRCRAGLSSICRQRKLIGAHRAGAFARFVSVPAAQCWPIPDGLSDTAASLAEPLACGVRAVGLARVAADEPLLILGAGPIGLCCLVTARAAGVRNVLISDVKERRLSVARRWGATHTLDASKGDILEQMREHFPLGVGAVVDAVGAGATRAQGVQAVMPGGRVVFLGLHDETSQLAANYLVRQEVQITGSFAYTSDEFVRALNLLIEGALAPDADWLEERPLAAGPASFDELVAGAAEATKIVLRLD